MVLLFQDGAAHAVERKVPVLFQWMMQKLFLQDLKRQVFNEEDGEEVGDQVFMDSVIV